MSKNRIVALREVPVDQLRPRADNLRIHPPSQRRILQSIIDELGYVAPLIVRESAAGYEIIDGHLRADLDPTDTVPVAIVDLDDHEATTAIRTLDPVAALAQFDIQALEQLAASGQLDDLPADLFPALSEIEPFDAESESALSEMPEFDNRGSDNRKISIIFLSDEAVANFSKTIDVEIGERTRYIHWPPGQRQRNNEIAQIAYDARNVSDLHPDKRQIR